MAAIDPLAAQHELSLTARGITSRRDIKVGIHPGPYGSGITFQLQAGDTWQDIPAHVDFVVNTLRNVTLGQGAARLCIVEHFLAAASLWGLTDIVVRVDGPEMPLGDGSARLWTDLFASHGLIRRSADCTITLPEPIICQNGDRLVAALPDKEFSLTYLMDWSHPTIGKKWRSFDATMDPLEIAHARTFGLLSEHQLLGIADQVVSLTSDGFTQPLHWDDEPVRHKLLDLLGDLTLSGVNPMAVKARFISIKAGHELDVELARRLAAVLRDSI